MMINNMAGIYIINDTQILMLRRTKKDSFDHYYSIGGKFEEGELNNPLQCVLRELKEEAGIEEKDLDHIHLKYIAVRKEKTYFSQNYIYFANLKKEINLPICNEGTLEWIEISNVFQLKLPASSLACLKHYSSYGNCNENIMLVGATNNNGKGKYQFIELLEFDDYDFDSIV